MSKSYYTQLKEDHNILNHIQIFETDFTKHDQIALKNYKGVFILGVRKTGTNLIKLFNSDENLPDKKEMEKKILLWIFGHGGYEWNERFFLGKDGIVKEVSMEEARQEINKYNDCKIYA